MEAKASERKQKSKCVAMPPPHLPPLQCWREADAKSGGIPNIGEGVERGSEEEPCITCLNILYVLEGTLCICASPWRIDASKNTHFKEEPKHVV